MTEKNDKKDKKRKDEDERDMEREILRSEKEGFGTIAEGYRSGEQDRDSEE